MMQDLLNWSPFFLAGRMFKPILPLMCDSQAAEDINQGIKKKRKAAVRLVHLRLGFLCFNLLKKNSLRLKNETCMKK